MADSSRWRGNKNKPRQRRKQVVQSGVSHFRESAAEARQAPAAQSETPRPRMRLDIDTGQRSEELPLPYETGEANRNRRQRQASEAGQDGLNVNANPESLITFRRRN